MILAGDDRADALPPGDRGLAYGDGLFETIAVAGGQAVLLERHLARLVHGLRRLRMPECDPAGLAEELAAAAAMLGRGVLKLIVTRGPGGRGYRPPEHVVATRLLDAHPWPDFPSSHAREGIVATVCETRLGLNPALAGVKHLNRLEQVLASMELPPGVAEGLMLDADGRVVEGTRSNVFLMLDDVLVTPLLSRCGVSGVMRGVILDAAVAAGRHCAVRDVALSDLARAQEVFVCNSLIGLWPVRALAGDGLAWPAPGPVAQAVLAGLAAAGVLVG